MYKGSKKTVLVFKGNGTCFDEAHFIVKENTAAGEDDIVKEANRIIAEYGSIKGVRTHEKKEKGSTFWFVSGLISGIVTFAFCLILCGVLM